MNYLQVIPLLFLNLLTACSPLALTYQDWHIKEREYDLRDSLYVPKVECSDIMKIKTGQTFRHVELLTGHMPVKNYFHDGIALLRTQCAGQDYEVAFKYGEDDLPPQQQKHNNLGIYRDYKEKVWGISFKPQVSILYQIDEPK